MEHFRRRAVLAALAVVGSSLAIALTAPRPAAGQATGQSPARATAQAASLPAGAADAKARLDASPRHGEWVMIPAGAGDSVRAWVVYPERKEKAPVVVVVHEIFGLSHWIRAVADQLAADGFVAIAPDFLTGKQVPEGPDGPERDAAVAAIRTVEQRDVQRRIDAAAQYATKLPAALQRYGIVGFCWGGSVSFRHAIHAPTLGAAVVYYGSSPDSDQLTPIHAPVLGLYGGNDARVNATIAAADSTMRTLGKPFEHRIFEGAGHGFLRQQDGQGGANLEATRAAWPMTVAFFRSHLK